MKQDFKKCLYVHRYAIDCYLVVNKSTKNITVLKSYVLNMINYV